MRIKTSFPAGSAAAAVMKIRAGRKERRLDANGVPILPAPSVLAKSIDALRTAQSAESYAPAWVALDGVTWFVARVISGFERRASYDLTALGFRVYAPLRRDRVLRGRVRGERKRQTRISVRPALPGYLFVGACSGRVVAKSMHEAVLDVLGVDGVPQAIPTSWVASINARECAGDFDSVGKPSAPVVVGKPVRWGLRGAVAAFEAGDAVNIVSGPFAGFQAVVSGLCADLAVDIEVAMFGRPVKTKIDACQLESV